MAVGMDDMDPMSSIFHERQEGSLCAQHCLNALLQGSYFTAVDLAEIARELDEAERQQMAVSGEHSEEYNRFIQQPSSNFDDSGFFSIQVIQRAVKVWSAELVPYTSPAAVAVSARSEPKSQQAYICNFREHWFTIRKLGNQWFNLNSLLTYPELVSNTYLSLLLTQLQEEGYSIFVVVGSLPDSDADQILKIVEAVQPIKPSLITDNKNKSGSKSSSTGGQFDDQDLQRALEESRRLVEEDDQSLKRALEMSMQGLPLDFAFGIENPQAILPKDNEASNSIAQPELSAEELRNKRLNFFNKSPSQSSTDVKTSEASANPATSSHTDSPTPDESTEQEMLDIALKMSMEGAT